MPVYFTYLIRWTDQNLSYYGVRYGKNSDPSSLWTTYFTSSDYVKSCIKLYGQPDVIQIRKTFSDKQEAFLWEQRVLKRLNVPYNKNWLNRNVGGCCRGVTENHNFLRDNPMKKSESKLRLSETRKRLGLGKESAKHLKPKYGADNPMKDPEIVAKFSAKVTGRRKRIREDGTWYWHYPEVV